MGFSVNKLLYEEANIRLSCNRILRTGIEFKIENLSDSEILVILNIALDRIGYNSWGGGNDWTIGTHGTKVCIENGDLTYVEHASMSLNGTVFINDIGAEEFSVCDSNLGGTEHLEINLSEGTKQYSTDAQGLNFYIENKREVSITIGFESFTINGEEQISGNVTTIPPHTKDIFALDILDLIQIIFQVN